MSAVLSADFAFLYPYAAIDARVSTEPPYRLVFLRSNNLDASALRLDDGALYEAHG